jgi:peroxiredoxin
MFCKKRNTNSRCYWYFPLSISSLLKTGSSAPQLRISRCRISLPVRETSMCFPIILPTTDATQWLYVFFASWCGLCLQEMKLVKSLTDSLYKGNLAMVAISVESEYGPSQQKFVKSIGLTCPILLDTLRRISKQYRIKQQLPYSVFITKKGIVYTTVSGYSPRAKRYIYLALDKMMASEQKGRK